MVKTLLRGLAPATLCAAALAAAAPAPMPSPSSRPDPLDPHVSVPALVYQSSLMPARRVDEQPPIPWREANDSVGRIGGWRTYAREAAEPTAAPAASMPSGYSGHSGHKTP
jgi:hypothetical protein